MTLNDRPDDASPPGDAPSRTDQPASSTLSYQPEMAQPHQQPAYQGQSFATQTQPTQTQPTRDYPPPPAPYQPQYTAPAYQNWAPTGYIPPSYGSLTKTPRFRRTPLLLAVAGLVAAIALGGITVQQFQASRSPRQVVQRYFAALSAGHAADALGFAVSPPHSPYLTDGVLRQQLALAKLSQVHIDNVTDGSGRATVNVDYTLASSGGSRLVHDQVPLVKRGSSWKLQTVAPLVDLDLSANGADRILVAGAKPPSVPTYLFPGAVPVDTDSSSVVVPGNPSVRLADDNQDVQLTPELTSAAKASLTKALTTALSACLSGKSTDANCPRVDDDRPVPGTLRGSVPPITSGISIALDSTGGGEVSLTGQVTVQGSWKVWDFNNQAVAKSGTTDLSVRAIASVANVDTVYWSAS